MANDTTNVNPLVLDTTDAAYTLANTITVHTAIFVNATAAGHNATIAQDSHTILDLAQNIANGSTSVTFPRGLTISKNRPCAITIDSGQLLLYHG